MDACGVQNLFFEPKLAIQAILDLQEGKTSIDCSSIPVSAITQANMSEKAAEMWGYVLWKEKNPG
ncbi:hypothetical protein F2981_24180 (plasmid) [Sinorhizobium meliloti]|nr:hypothetical protein [Sinorhizobium meliloti]